MDCKARVQIAQLLSQLLKHLVSLWGSLRLAVNISSVFMVVILWLLTFKNSINSKRIFPEGCVILKLTCSIELRNTMYSFPSLRRAFGGLVFSCFFLCVSVAGDRTQGLGRLGEHFTTEPHPQSTLSS
jgi:hypothetical protein